MWQGASDRSPWGHAPADGVIGRGGGGHRRELIPVAGISTDAAHLRAPLGARCLSGFEEGDSPHDDLAALSDSC